MPTQPGLFTRLFRDPSPRTFLRFALVSVIGLFAIVPSGGLVRLTGSGLGCPDWPGCKGQVVPPISAHTLIEYSNRVLSFLIVAVVVITYLVARKVKGAPRGMSRWALLAAASSVGQGPLGGITVIFDLHPVLVASHFLLSLVALAGGIVAYIIGRDHQQGIVRGHDVTRSRVALGMLATLTAVVVTGVLVTSSGPHSGDPKVIRQFWNISSAAAVHVRVVIAFVGIAVAFLLWMRRNRLVTPQIKRLALTFTPLLVAQIIIGEYQYRNHMPWQVIAFHVAIAGLLFGTGVAIAWLVGHPAPEPLTAVQSERVGVPARQAASTDPV